MWGAHLHRLQTPGPSTCPARDSGGCQRGEELAESTPRGLARAVSDDPLACQAPVGVNTAADAQLPSQPEALDRVARDRSGPCAQTRVLQGSYSGKTLLGRQMVLGEDPGAKLLTLSHGRLEDQLPLQVLRGVPSSEEVARRSPVFQLTHLGHLQVDVLLLPEALRNLLVFQAQSLCKAMWRWRSASLGLLPRSWHWGGLRVELASGDHLGPGRPLPSSSLLEAVRAWP